MYDKLLAKRDDNIIYCVFGYIFFYVPEIVNVIDLITSNKQNVDFASHATCSIRFFTLTISDHFSRNTKNQNIF